MVWDRGDRNRDPKSIACVGGGATADVFAQGNPNRRVEWRALKDRRAHLQDVIGAGVNFQFYHLMLRYRDGANHPERRPEVLLQEPQGDGKHGGTEGKGNAVD